MMQKIFIVGLPRTGTTSLCAAFLDLGFRTAHTAFTQHAIEQADVIADTPIYCDYQRLHKMYPNSKFIYLDRNIDEWVNSIRHMLNSVKIKYQDSSSPPERIILRCLVEIFGPIDNWESLKAAELKHSYCEHRARAHNYFQQTGCDAISVSINEGATYARLLDFLKLDKSGTKSLPHLNRDGRIYDWGRVKHPLKVSSHQRSGGKAEGQRIYLTESNTLL